MAATKQAKDNADTKKQTKRKKAQEAEATVEETKVVAKAEPTEAEQIAEKDLEIAALRAELERQREAINQLQKPQVIVTQADAERVHFLWIANVADDNVKSFGEGGMYGRIVGKTGNFFVPKNELSRILDESNRNFIDKRNLIVISGLNEEEREMLGVNYKEGELLDVKTFRDIAKLPHDLLIEVFKDLCETHKEMVALRLNEAYSNGSYVARDTVKELNAIYPSAAFKDIIESMNEKDLGNE